MSTWRLFVAPLILPILFTALVLTTVARNRSGGRDAIELTERELSLSGASDDNSGMTASLAWSRDGEPGRRWLSAQKLEAFGFDLSVDSRDPSRRRFSSRQLQRRVYVVLELRDSAPERRSRLVPVDASRDLAELLAKYPNGRTHLISSGLIGIRPDEGPDGPFVDGDVVSIEPRGVHVPTEFAERLRQGRGRGQTFTISIRYGSRLSPWIVDVR